MDGKLERLVLVAADEVDAELTRGAAVDGRWTAVDGRWAALVGYEFALEGRGGSATTSNVSFCLLACTISRQEGYRLVTPLLFAATMVWSIVRASFGMRSGLGSQSGGASAIR